MPHEAPLGLYLQIVPSFPFAEMQDALFTEDVRHECPRQYNHEGPMHQQRSPLTPLPKSETLSYTDEIEHHEQLQQHEERGIIHQSLRRRRPHPLLDEGGKSQASGIDQHQHYRRLRRGHHPSDTLAHRLMV